MSVLTRFVGMMFVVVFFSGCSTMFTGTTKNINLMSSSGKSAEVQVISESGTQTVTVPAVVNIKRGKDVTISVKESDCYEASTIIVPKRINMWFFANYFNYFTGSTTDAVNGAMWNYDDNVYVPVNKKSTCTTN